MRTWVVCQIVKIHAYYPWGDQGPFFRCDLQGYVNADSFDEACAIATEHWPLSIDDLEITCTDIYGPFHTELARARAVNGAA